MSADAVPSPPSAAAAEGPPPRPTGTQLARRLAAEAVGTAFLLMAVVGSGIMAERLTDDVGLQLLANDAATVGALAALILALGAVSGAHLNPAVTLADRLLGGIDSRTAAGYVGAQVVGGILGCVLANLMFDLPAVELSANERAGAGLLLGEVVATLGLLLVIFGVVRSGRTSVVAFAVAGYIGGAYWFTSSTSFANPAVTVARTLSDTFTGIAPSSAPAFIAAQLTGALLAVGLAWALWPQVDEVADQVVLPHDGP